MEQPAPLPGQHGEAAKMMELQRKIQEMQKQLNAQTGKGGNYSNQMQQELNAIMDMHSNLLSGSVGAHLPPRPPPLPIKGTKAEVQLAH